MRPNRRWYLMFQTEGVLEALVGPFRGGEDTARRCMESLLAVDLQISDELDWNDPHVRCPVLFTSVRCIDLSPEEIDALEKPLLANLANEKEQ